jgi:hypothetical protein
MNPTDGARRTASIGLAADEWRNPGGDGRVTVNQRETTMARIQSRRSNGRFQRNTLEVCCGLHCEICPNGACRSFNPYGVGEPAPTHCHRCAAVLAASEAPEAHAEE